MLFNTLTKNYALAGLGLFVMCQWMIPAQAEPITDVKVRQTILMRWQPRINAHRISNPEMAALEEKMLQAKLNGDPSYARLFGDYLELKARRTPVQADAIRQRIAPVVHAQELARAIIEDREHNRLSAAKAKQAELDQVFKNLCVTPAY